MRISDWSSDVCSSDLIGAACMRIADGDGEELKESKLRALVGRRDQRRQRQRGRGRGEGGELVHRAIFSHRAGAGRGAAILRRSSSNTSSASRTRPASASSRPRFIDPSNIRRSSSSRKSWRSEEHTSELQSLMRISYAVFCLKKKKTTK